MTYPAVVARPGSYDIVVTQGGALREPFRWVRRTPPSPRKTPVALAGGKARAQFRIDRQPVLTFDSNPAAAPDGTITLTDDGVIEMYAAPAALSAAHAGSGDWSLEVEPLGEDRRVLLAGRVTIIRESTL